MLELCQGREVTEQTARPGAQGLGTSQEGKRVSPGRGFGSRKPTPGNCQWLRGLVSSHEEVATRPSAGLTSGMRNPRREGAHWHPSDEGQGERLKS